MEKQKHVSIALAAALACTLLVLTGCDKLGYSSSAGGSCLEVGNTDVCDRESEEAPADEK